MASDIKKGENRVIEYVKKEDVKKQISRFIGILDEDTIYRINLSIDWLETVKKTEEFYFCKGCKEYDYVRNRCPRWNHLIHETLKEIGGNHG